MQCQKYRIHTNKRYILPKNDGRRLPNNVNQTARLHQCKPFGAFPLNQQHFSVWGIPTCFHQRHHHQHHYPFGIHTWWPHNGSYQTCSHFGIWPWKTSTTITDGDAWGWPVVLQENPFSTQVHLVSKVHHSQMLPQNNMHVALQFIIPWLQGEDMIDQVLKEAISKPWLPLPLGLKPPSAECVLAELQRQGIHRIHQSSTYCNLQMTQFSLWMIMMIIIIMNTFLVCILKLLSFVNSLSFWPLRRRKNN